MTFFKPNTKRTAYIAKNFKGAPFMVTFMTDDGFEDILDCYMRAESEAEAIQIAEANGFTRGLD